MAGSGQAAVASDSVRVPRKRIGVGPKWLFAPAVVRKSCPVHTILCRVRIGLGSHQQHPAAQYQVVVLRGRHPYPAHRPLAQGHQERKRPHPPTRSRHRPHGHLPRLGRPEVPHRVPQAPTTSHGGQKPCPHPTWPEALRPRDLGLEKSPRPRLDHGRLENRSPRRQIAVGTLRCFFRSRRNRQPR